MSPALQKSPKRLVKPSNRLAPMEALEQYALAHCIRSGHEARGVCLWASVEMAARAAQLGLSDQVCLLRWRLNGDLAYLEHWALKVSDDRVLDLTAIQVDGNPTPWRQLASYPSHYGTPSQYPIELVLPHVPPRVASARIQRRVLWRLHRELARYEVALAMRRKALTECAAAGRALCAVASRLALGFLLERAIERLSLLLHKLQ